jgi:RNA polymerase sigma-B factor
MAVSHRRGTARSGAAAGDLDDLDLAAATYSRQWADASPDRRDRLRENLISSCLPFANRMAGRYRDRGEPVEDLEQVARLGLIEAVDRFDPARGSFTAFAVATISGEIKRHFRDRTWRVHVPRRLQDLSLEVRHATAGLTATLARRPTVAEIAACLRVDEDEVLEAIKCTAGHSPVSFSKPVGEAGSPELGDLMGDDDAALETVADRLTVGELLQRLPERERRMLSLRFHGNHTQSEIAAELGISQMHVSRVLSRALTWLRAAMLCDVAPRWDRADTWHDITTSTVLGGCHDDTVTVHVRGEIGRDTAERLRLDLRRAVAMVTSTEGRIVVDLAAVPLIDATGVAVLLDAAAVATSAKVRMVLAAPRPYVARLLDLSGLGGQFAVES